MNLQNRIDLMLQLCNYLKNNDNEWREIKTQAGYHNPWFTEEFIDLAVKNITNELLIKENLIDWINFYHLDDLIQPKKIGIIMAGNIPLVGFHDFLSVFISGHLQLIKLSTKDTLLFKHLLSKLILWNDDVKNQVQIADKLNDCDAYIATGSSQSAAHFETYFSKYPNIIRHNKTSIAILEGNEKEDELALLADDIHNYFGLGCRNVTKIYVPTNYNFIPLIQSFNKYKNFKDHHKYQNNFDYQLSIMLLNNVKYMTNESTLLVEDKSIFSAISVVHYEYYDSLEVLKNQLLEETHIQCIVAKDSIPFGKSQTPSLFDYADKIDTMQFLLSV